ncbi:MAG: response regulator, partial [Spirochaetota bacterium]
MNLRILIADDESLERRALSSIISSIDTHKIELVEAANGRQAVEAAGTGLLDMAFLDIRMPGMDGLKAAHELKILHPEIHIIFVTAFDHFDYAREAIRLGVDEYLVKPASSDEIRGTVLRIADRIIAGRATRNPAGKTGLPDQKALELLEEELRMDLARGDLDSKRMVSFLRLKGLGQQPPVAAIIRFSSAGLPESSIRQAQLHRVMDLMEHQLRTNGNYVLSGSDGTELRCMYIHAGPVPLEQPVSAIPSSAKDTFQKVVNEVRNILGVRIVIGACTFPIHDETVSAKNGVDPFITASDAVSIAVAGQAVVMLAAESPASTGGNTNGLRQSASTVERAIGFMHKHLSEDISLSDVAEAVGTAPSHLSRLFNRYSGDTFIHVLCRLRIDTAKKLLRTSQYRVKEVYTMVGFNDQAYFS